MARADTWTLLCIDDWARYMGIHPDAWNQVVYPTPYPGACERVWIQNGWMDMTSGRILGREDVAIAIATAEEMIARACGFWPAPTWTLAEEHEWPLPARGAQIAYPPIQLDWGYIIEGGQRAMTAIELAAAVLYYDADGDGINEMAAVTVTAAQLAAAGAIAEEVSLFFAGETDPTWEIRCLSVTEDALTGDVTVTGRASQFVEPASWLIADDVDITNPFLFADTVDVYRVYNDPTNQAQVIWKGGGDSCSPTVCAETCQSACLSIENTRLSIVHAIPSTYAASTWTAASFSECRLPDSARFWYQSGLLLQSNGKIKPMLAEAIVRLANTYMVDEPCGCQVTKHRWARDREEQDINSYDAQLCMSAFGSTMKGALFAWSVIKRLPPIARGGAVT